MSFDSEPVRRHYEQGGNPGEMVDRVSRQIDAMGGRFLSAVQTAALDQFHVRGLVATDELAQLVSLHEQMKVLDAGSGLGGPSRYLAETYGCEVLGVDLTPSYVALARHIAHRSIAAYLLRYEQGNLLALPADDGSFDVVWTQHALMNVEDRFRAYAEFQRVLRPGGKLACYDIVAKPDKPEIAFPVPWASGPGASHLLTKDETVTQAQVVGLALDVWTDMTRLALNWFGQQPHWSPNVLSLASVMGPRIHEMAANLARNFREGRLGVAMFIFVKGQS